MSTLLDVIRTLPRDRADTLRQQARKGNIGYHKGNGNRNHYRDADVRALWPQKFLASLNLKAPFISFSIIQPSAFQNPLHGSGMKQPKDFSSIGTLQQTQDLGSKKKIYTWRSV